MVSDSCDEETAKRSDEINKRKKRIDRNSNIVSGLGALLMLGGVISTILYGGYMRESSQVVNSKKTLDYTIENIEGNIKKRSVLLSFNDSIISENLRTANEIASKQREPLEKALKRSYELRSEILNHPEYRNYSDTIDYLNWTTIAGFLLALLGILSYGKVGTALLVLGVPMIDAIYTLMRRIGRKKSPVLADRGHLHHKLLDLGWSKRKIASLVVLCPFAAIKKPSEFS